jgi:hypothetical protein
MATDDDKCLICGLSKELFPHGSCGQRDSIQGHEVYEIIYKMQQKLCPNYRFEKGWRNYFIVWHYPNNEWHYDNECIKEAPGVLYFQNRNQAKQVAKLLNRIKGN